MFCGDALGLLTQAPKAAWRRLSGRPALVLLKHRRALGDRLMLTPLARALKRHCPQLHVAVAAPGVEVFLRNPNFDEVRAWHLFRTDATVNPQYSFRPGLPHLVVQMWRSVWDGLPARGPAQGACPEISVHPEIFLSEAELARGREALGRRGRPVVLLMSGGKTKPTWNREWGFANFQALANALAPHADLMQLSGDRPLQLDGGAAVRYPRLGVREAAAALAACDAFVTQEGGLMHLARAVSAPTVAIFGGTILPAQSGYAEQTNLFQERECAPCLEQRRNCPHLNCMAAITVRRVFEAVTRLLAQRGFSLPPEAIASAPDRWTPPEFLTDLESR